MGDRRRTPVGGVQAKKLLRYVRLIARGVNNSGWMNYYGRYGRGQLFLLLRRVSTDLRRWAAKKYKRLRRDGRYILGQEPLGAFDETGVRRAQQIQGGGARCFSYYNRRVEVHDLARKHGVADEHILYAID